MDEIKAVIYKEASELRPWAEFVGPLTSPKWTQVDVHRRLNANAIFFKINYGLILLIFIVIRFWMTPWDLLFIFISMILFAAVFLTRNKSLSNCNGRLNLTIERKLMITAIVTSTILLWSGNMFRLQSTISAAVFACFCHALFRPPVARAFAMLNETSGADVNSADDIEDGALDWNAGSTYSFPSANMRIRNKMSQHSENLEARLPVPTRVKMEKNN